MLEMFLINSIPALLFREVFNGYFELEGSMKMNLQQASRKIPYKYVVAHPQGNNRPPKILWECLIGFKPIVGYAHVNRCLDIREDSLKSNGKILFDLHKSPSLSLLS